MGLAWAMVRVLPKDHNPGLLNAGPGGPLPHLPLVGEHCVPLPLLGDVAAQLPKPLLSKSLTESLNPSLTNISSEDRQTLAQQKQLG